MITSLTWIDVYVFMKNNPQDHYFSSEMYPKIKFSHHISWVSLLDGINKLETIGAITTEKVGNKKIIKKTKKFFELENIFEEIEIITTRKEGASK